MDSAPWQNSSTLLVPSAQLLKTVIGPWEAQSVYCWTSYLAVGEVQPEITVWGWCGVSVEVEIAQVA